MIPFNKPPRIGTEENYVFAAMQSPKMSGDGAFSQKCQCWFEQYLPCPKALLTPSCTQALELAALLINIQPDDEVIMPSYTFVSTANAFVLRGAKVVFVDIRPDTMNMDETKIEAAITPKTKAIVPVHYAGVACGMDKIMQLAEKYHLWVIEDAAQAMMAKYKNQYLGTIGHFGTFSFHETKNYTSGGEGGVLLINDTRFIERAEIIREKGTNRSQFFRGMVDKYSWCDIGSSYLPSELQAAYLWAQIANPNIILENRLKTWHYYFEKLTPLAKQGKLTLPTIPANCTINANMFYLKLAEMETRTKLIEYLKQQEIMAVFHYIPLHSTKFGKQQSRFNGDDIFTTKESKRLVRLPLYYGISRQELEDIIKHIYQFFA